MFTDENCENPCWMGIEVGVSDKELVKVTLEQNEIRYSPNGLYTYNIFLDKTTSLLWQNIETPLADIHFWGETVGLMTFTLDLCLSSVIDAYGYPEVVMEETSAGILYPGYGLNFLFDTDTQRITGVILYALGYIEENFTVAEREQWESYSDLLDKNCMDSLSID